MSIPNPLQQVDRTFVWVGKRKLSYFAGCDYFRLASHPDVTKAVTEGMKKYGLNVAASRLTTGNHELFGKLESSIARFFGAESATLVSNGYVTNLVVSQALAGEFTDTLIDEKAHPSLKDAAQLVGATLHPFQHRNSESLANAAKQLPKSAKTIVLTDGMFSHDGGIAPLASYLKVIPKSALLLVDDAHGGGTLGKSGKGSIELENIPRDRVIQTITLSKAFGVYGGAILGSAELREKIVARSRMFVGSTPLPLPLAHAANTSIKLLQSDKQLRRQLRENVELVKKDLREFGYDIAETPSPIIAIAPATKEKADQIKARCLGNGVFPSFIKYPGGPENGYFRFVISSEHTKAQLRALSETLKVR